VCGVRISRWPGRIEAGRHSAVPVTSVDFLPTLQTVAGAPLPEPCDGVDLLPVLTGTGRLPERELFWHVPVYLQNPGRHASDAREGVWRVSPAGAIRSGHYKLIEWFDDGGLELYDLEADIGERHNLADEQPDVAHRLQQRLQAWRAETGAPVPDQTNPELDPEAFAAAAAR
jgi:arylsulfatase A-like enzyme